MKPFSKGPMQCSDAGLIAQMRSARAVLMSLVFRRTTAHLLFCSFIVSTASSALNLTDPQALALLFLGCEISCHFRHWSLNVLLTAQGSITTGQGISLLCPGVHYIISLVCLCCLLAVFGRAVSDVILKLSSPLHSIWLYCAVLRC